MNIVEVARGFMGTPWVYRGRSTSGVDCVGLVVLVARELGVQFQDFLEYGRGQADLRLLRNFCRIGEKTPVRDTKGGDIIIFAERTQPGHCGILTQVDSVIHCSILRRGVVEEPLKNVPGQHIATFRIKHG